MTSATVVWGAAIAGCVVYEALALVMGWELLSTAVRRASAKTLLVPFLAGLLMGHFFFCGCQ